MSFKYTIYKFIVFTLVLFSVFYIFNFVTDKKDALANINTKQVVEVFKTPSCGCCYGYVLFLEEEKFKVKQTDMRSLHTIKQKYNIPVEMQSCHTTIMGKYFIEGHVPFEAVEKLLKEQPDIDGFLERPKCNNREKDRHCILFWNQYCRIFGIFVMEKSLPV